MPLSPQPVEVRLLPECYVREKKRARWYYWLVPSKSDPRNAAFAEWAGVVALIEWLAAMVFMLLPLGCGGTGPLPDRYYLSLWSLMAVLGMLTCLGYRGMISGHVKKLGSTLLFLVNGGYFTLLSYICIMAWWDDR